jgi:hypothetical protein
MASNNALSALLVVFSILTGGLAILFCSMLYLGARNASRRRARKKNHETFLGLDRDGIRERLPTLTTGDLVMDPYVTEQVEKLAHQLSAEQSTNDGGDASGGHSPRPSA